MQYMIMYTLGVIKSQTIVLPQVMNPIDTIDRIVYQRYLINTMSPDEVLAMFNPQIISVSNRELSDQEYPPLEPLERRAIRND
jgi:hypothetical protein